MNPSCAIYLLCDNYISTWESRVTQMTSLRLHCHPVNPAAKAVGYRLRSKTKQCCTGARAWCGGKASRLGFVGGKLFSDFAKCMRYLVQWSTPGPY